MKWNKQYLEKNSLIFICKSFIFLTNNNTLQNFIFIGLKKGIIIQKVGNSKI